MLQLELIVKNLLPATDADNDNDAAAAITCIRHSLLVVIVVSAILVALFLTAVAFVFGVLVGVYRTKTKQAITTVSAAHSEADTPAISETAAGVELERPHEYEDIVPYSKPGESDTFTSNIAYGIPIVH